MLTDDLLGSIALDALRACIPREDITICIQHEDGIVAHVLDQQPKAFFALTQAFLVVATVGEIAGHFREPAQRAALVPNRGDDDVGPEHGPVLPYPPALF